MSVGGEELGYCALPACDPLGADCDGGCWFDTHDHAGCFPRAGTKRRGESCDYDDACGRGLACGPQHVCTPQCRLSGDDCDGKRCLPIEGEDLSLDGIAYGYCER
jgi:hypothetical protein